MTLVELMVALAISLVVSVAAAAALSVARQGFTSVDEVSRLNDSARFATAILERLALQAGYRDSPFASQSMADLMPLAAPGGEPLPAVQGFNNALILNAGSPTDAAHNNRDALHGGCASVTDTACLNGSDVLILRHQTSESVPGSGQSDGAMINCAGFARDTAPSGPDDLITSVLHVARSSAGEPALMCSYQAKNGAWATPQPLVEGVEGFQVLYGIGPLPTDPAVDHSLEPSVIRYLRADQVDVDGNAAASTANWHRVRSLRIGLLLRGPVKSAAGNSLPGQHYFLLGEGMSVSAQDPGTEFVAPSDGRIRRVTSFTVVLRNGI